MNPHAAIVLLAAAAGLAMGSFVATWAMRWTRGASAFSGRSVCDSCHRSLGFAETLPVLSFVGQGGRCRRCRASIDMAHPMGELAGAGVLVGSAFISDPLRALLFGALGLVLLFASIVDARTRRLPDRLTIVVAGLGAALSALHARETFWVGLVASAVSLLLLLLVRGLATLRLQQSALGLGDVKLVAALALWLGAATPWMVAGAAAIGLIAVAILRPSDGKIAFGPAIALSAAVTGLGLEVGLWPSIA